MTGGTKVESDLELLEFEMTAAYIGIWICSISILILYKKRGYMFTEEEKPAVIPVLVLLVILTLIGIETVFGYGSGCEIFGKVFFGT